MNNMFSNLDVAPHGIIGFIAVCLLVVLAVHLLGFSVVGAVKVAAG